MPCAPLAARAAAALALALAACSPHLEAQRTYSQFLTPARLQPAGAEAQPVARVFKVRAYVDPDYRAHAPDWRERIAGQVEQANVILASDFGVRLELEPVREWERARAGDGLEGTLGALLRLDAARDVDWVIGFVAPVPEDSPRDYHAVGMASMFGRHFVVRAMQTSGDLARIDAVYDQLTEEERTAFARARRVHQEATVFLHEWGHTLGAVHECDSKWIMAPTYSVLRARFSPDSARLVRLGLTHRDAPSAPELGWASAWRAEAVRMQGVAWECEKLERALADADRFLAGAVRPTAAGR